ncbi:GMC oxidoreductase [Ramaria rubella]|nr:GMC oxidoreductase [Ramaria rubella]
MLRSVLVVFSTVLLASTKPPSSAKHSLSDNGTPAHEFDYVIVGGGTAGSVLANRLTEDPEVTVAVIEGGPSDVGLKEVQVLKNWMHLLETKYDYGYSITEQPNGNSHIVHSRAKVLGGCSSHNTLISFHPFTQDLDDWAELGNIGWKAIEIRPYGDRIKMDFRPIALKDRNAAASAWIASVANATGAKIVSDFNAEITSQEGMVDAVGFLSVAYDPYTGHRDSASVAYLHPIMGVRDNLHLFLETWVHGFVWEDMDSKKVSGVRARSSGEELVIRARREVILSAGAIDSPRLLLLSGVGPEQELRTLGIKPMHHLLGVGENLMDHVETIVMWNASSTPKRTVMFSDAALFHRFNVSDPRPDLMSHVYQIPFTDNIARLGYPSPVRAFAMTPNVPRPVSRGKLSLASSDPSIAPLIDFRYFTDSCGEDAALLVRGVRLARKIAETPPFSEYIGEEIFPGLNVTSNEDISYLARKASNTVYHSSGTCKMGPSTDEMAVVDERLRVKGLKGLRIVDASIFPTLPTVNPMVLVLTVAERAADMIKEDAFHARIPILREVHSVADDVQQPLKVT